MVDDIGGRYRRRDYTKEIVTTRPIPQSGPVTNMISTDIKKPNKSKKWIRVIFNGVARLVVLGVVIVAGVWAWHHFKHQPASEPDLNGPANQQVPLSDIAQSVKFPIYYPSNLPAGFSQARQPRLTAGVVTIGFAYNGKSISVSEQAIPATIKIPPNPQKFNLSIGTGWLTSINGQATGLIQTKDTLVTITSGQGLSADVITQLMQSFTQLH